MFYYQPNLIRRVRIHPQYSGGKNDPHKMVKKMLVQDIRENFFDKKNGYIADRVCVTSIGEGFCLPLVGYIEFLVAFEAILFYPVIGETVYAEVEMVTDTCIIFRHVCAYGVVRSYGLNEEDKYKYEERDVVPDEQKQNKGTFKEGLFRSTINAEKVIEKGTVILLRITRRTLGGNGFFLIGSMTNSDFLGPVVNPPAAIAHSEVNTLIPAHRFGRQGGPMPTFEVGEDVIPSVERAKILTERLFFSNDADSSDNEDAASISSLKPE